MGKDYVYALVPFLVAADGMHHSEAHGAGYRRARRQDAMVHLLNLVVWPNIFESSPHVINAVMEAIEGMRCCLGQTRVLQHVLQGLFHPARKVREVYWKVCNNLYIGAQPALVPCYPRWPRAVASSLSREIKYSLSGVGTSLTLHHDEHHQCDQAHAMYSGAPARWNLSGIQSQSGIWIRSRHAHGLRAVPSGSPDRSTGLRRGPGPARDVGGRGRGTRSG